MRKFNLVAGLALLAGCASDAAQDGLAGPSFDAVEAPSCKVHATGVGDDRSVITVNAREPVIGPPGIFRINWPGGDRFMGSVHTVSCFVNSIVIATLRGDGRFNGVDGHTFVLDIHQYAPTLGLPWDTSLEVRNSAGEVVHTTGHVPYARGRLMITVEF